MEIDYFELSSPILTAKDVLSRVTREHKELYKLVDALPNIGIHEDWTYSIYGIKEDKHNVTVKSHPGVYVDGNRDVDTVSYWYEG